jgi:hypothetical protein
VTETVLVTFEGTVDGRTPVPIAELGMAAFGPVAARDAARDRRQSAFDPFRTVVTGSFPDRAPANRANC